MTVDLTTNLPVPKDKDTDGGQTNQTSIIQIPSDEALPSHKGLQPLPESLEDLVAIDPKYIGGVAQSYLVPAMLRDAHNQNVDLSKKNESLREADTEQRIALARLETLLSSNGGINLVAMTGNTIGVGLIGFGIDLIDISEKYGWGCIIAGGVLASVCWFVSITRFNRGD